MWSGSAVGTWLVRNEQPAHLYTPNRATDQRPAVQRYERNERVEVGVIERSAGLTTSFDEYLTVPLARISNLIFMPTLEVVRFRSLAVERVDDLLIRLDRLPIRRVFGRFPFVHGSDSSL
jgi:hypothetical protein